MLKIKIAIPCKEGNDTCFLDRDETRKEIEELKSAEIADIDLSINRGNTLTLTQFGNKFINECKNDFDYLILMHSDVLFSLKTFVNKLIEVKDKYDVIGFAGTKKLTLNESPLTWFTGSNIFFDKRYGQVTQKVGNEYVSSLFNATDPNTTDTEVVTIDGLMMCLSRKAMQSDVLFDEQFTYDFYDLDYCLSIQTKTTLKIGVIVQSDLVHESPGAAILNEKYLIPEGKFRTKWMAAFAVSPKIDQ